VAKQHREREKRIEKKMLMWRKILQIYHSSDVACFTTEAWKLLSSLN
jgi:hypothetical protein